MTYDKLTVMLLSMLSTEERNSTNALVARYLLEHAGEVADLSVKELAAACHVGTGTVSRFARDAGFGSFGELKDAFAGFGRAFEQVEGPAPEARAAALASHVSSTLGQVAASLDYAALDRLVSDLVRYEKVSAFGLLKAQAAALDLQVDLLMQGKHIETCTSLAEQMERIAQARSDELVILFSYTGAYFEYRDLAEALRRLNRPRLWMVCGERRRLPNYVSDVLFFDSSLDKLGHPYQLEFVAGLIAQEFATQRAE